MNLNLMRLSFYINGYPIEKAESFLKSIQDECSKDVGFYQNQKKWEIFKHHVENNSAYTKFVGDRTINSWEDIPILTKTNIQQPLELRLSEGYNAKNTHLHNTSGSSGTPFYFAKDKFCHALSWALIYQRFGQHGIEIGKDYQARFYGIPLSRLKYLIEKVKDLIAARSRFPVFDLSDVVLEKYLEKFKVKKFSYINGYTSSLVLFARYLINQNIRLKDVCPTLKAAFTTSEVCDEIDRKLLEKAYGVKIVNEYGAAELDLIGFEDLDSDWILNNETLFVEVLDEDNKPAEPGKEGRVVVTSLYNKAMPFIRYELGDTIILKKYHKGTYQIIDKVTGRTNDIAILPSGKKSPGLTFYYISKSLLEGGGFMKEFIIRQTSLSHFHYEYVADRELNDDEKSKVFSAMDKYLEKGLSASFERKAIIERTKAGKLKHFFLDFIP